MTRRRRSRRPADHDPHAYLRDRAASTRWEGWLGAPTRAGITKGRPYAPGQAGPSAGSRSTDASTPDENHSPSLFATTTQRQAYLWEKRKLQPAALACLLSVNHCCSGPTPASPNTETRLALKLDELAMTNTVAITISSVIARPQPSYGPFFSEMRFASSRRGPRRQGSTGPEEARGMKVRCDPQ